MSRCLGGLECTSLIVSVSFGAPVLFKWRGTFLVMDGQCQDEFLHCTSPGLECGRINVTYRWVLQHTHFCSLFKARVVCCLPTCAKGSSVHVTGNLGYGCFWAFLFLPCALCTLGVIGWASYLLWCSGLGSCWCAFFRFRSLGVGRFGYYLLDLGEDNGAAHNTVPLFLGWVFCFCFWFVCILEALYASHFETAQSPWLLCMYGFFGLRGHSGEIAG